MRFRCQIGSGVFLCGGGVGGVFICGGRMCCRFVLALEFSSSGFRFVPLLLVSVFFDEDTVGTIVVG
ncbi:hypothetical protein Bca4012_084410 [Brassica carinata]